MKRWPGWIWSALLFAGLTGQADAEAVKSHSGAADGPHDAASAQRVAVEQRLTLVQGMLSNSAVVRRVNAIGSAEAKGLLTQARRAQAAAKAALGAGDFSRAGSLLDEAMRDIGHASRLTPNPSQAAEQERLRYEELRTGFDAMLNSYERSVERARASNAAPSPRDSEVEQARAKRDRAATLARAGRYAEAGDLIEEAQGKLVNRLNHLLGTTTLVYDLAFETPEQEYQYTLQRYKSFEGLLPAARTRLSRADALRQLDAEVESGKKLQAQALAAAGERAYSGALQLLHRAIEHLQRALEISGLVLEDAAPGASRPQ